MGKPSRPVRGALLAAVFATFAGACGPSAAERVETSRAAYEVRLDGFVAQEGPLAPPSGDGPAGDPVPERRDVVLDLVVEHDAEEPLPGITIDIAHAGPDGEEKDRYRAWLDTSGVERGEAVPMTYTLDEVAYRVGDRFTVAVQSPVPLEQRGDYREFTVQ
jgi:hypothetical protein